MADTERPQPGTVSKKIADTVEAELAQSKAKLVLVRDLLAKKNAKIDQLEVDINELRTAIPTEKLTEESHRKPRHTLADSIQRYRNRFDDKSETRITRKPRKVKVYYNGKSMMLDAYMGAQDLPAQLRSPVRANTRAACKGQLMREIREVIIVQPTSLQQYWIRLHEGDIISWVFDVEEPNLAVAFAVKKSSIQASQSGKADKEGGEGEKEEEEEEQEEQLHGPGSGTGDGPLMEVPWNGMIFQEKNDGPVMYGGDTTCEGLWGPAAQDCEMVFEWCSPSSSSWMKSNPKKTVTFRLKVFNEEFVDDEESDEVTVATPGAEADKNEDEDESESESESEADTAEAADGEDDGGES